MPKVTKPCSSRAGTGTQSPGASRTLQEGEEDIPEQSITKEEEGKSSKGPGSQLHVGLVQLRMGGGQHCLCVQHPNCHNWPGGLQAQPGQVIRLRWPMPRGGLVTKRSSRERTHHLTPASCHHTGPDIQPDVNQWGGQWGISQHTHRVFLPPSMELVLGLSQRRQRDQFLKTGGEHNEAAVQRP